MSWIAKMKTDQQLSESHHSKSNTSYAINSTSLEITNTTSGNSILHTKTLWKAVFKKNKKEKHWVKNAITVFQWYSVYRKASWHCFFTPSHYIKLLKLSWLSHSNFILQFSLYRTGILVLLYFRWALWHKMRTSKIARLLLKSPP